MMMKSTMSEAQRFQLLHRLTDLASTHKDAPQLVESMLFFAHNKDALHIAIFSDGEWYIQLQVPARLDFSALPSVECS